MNVIDLDKEGKVTREQVWLVAWVAVAGANDCKRPEIATIWADHCLRDFDKRFPKGLSRED